jgi:hypothetical protein
MPAYVIVDLDPEYAPWKALRLRVSQGSMIPLEGLQG